MFTNIFVILATKSLVLADTMRYSHFHFRTRERENLNHPHRLRAETVINQ